MGVCGWGFSLRGMNVRVCLFGGDLCLFGGMCGLCVLSYLVFRLEITAFSNKSFFISQLA